MHLQSYIMYIRNKENYNDFGSIFESHEIKLAASQHMLNKSNG